MFQIGGEPLGLTTSFLLANLTFQQMLVKDSSQRLPLHKVLEHPWIVQYADPTGVYKGWLVI